MKLTRSAIILNWIAVYPTITILLGALEPMLSAWPLPLRTLVISALMVPLTATIAMPIVNVAFGRILNRPPLAIKRLAKQGSQPPRHAGCD